MFTKNHKPLSFEKPALTNYDGEITIGAMVNFFVMYMCSDSIGNIATAHLVASDRLGIFSEVPMGLAKKHSMAVDFPKTGVVPDNLTEEEKIVQYPDYLSFGRFPTYKSKWLPGPMTRRVRSVVDIIDQNYVRVCKVSVDADMSYGVWNDFKAGATVTYKYYRQQLFSLLSEYGIASEFQLFSGHFTDCKGRLAKGERDDYSLFTTERIVRIRLKGLIAKFRNWFAREFKVAYSELATNERALSKASAWYMVAYGDNEAIHSRSAFSFAWLVWDLLAVVKERRPANVKIHGNPMMSHLERLIETATSESNCASISKLMMCAANSDYNTGMKQVLCVYLNWCLRSGFAGPDNLSNFADIFAKFMEHLKSSSHVVPFEVDNSVSDEKEQPGVQRQYKENNHVSAALVDAAFKAYHKAALSGNFSSFYLEKPWKMDWDVKEMEPMTFLPPEEYTSSAKARYMYNRLKEWSGVIELAYRHKGYGYFIVSAIGSLSARSRLYELLVCEDLESALRHDVCPL
uniref:RNA-dependent RNA polymerase n=1 Tax=Trichuris muris TaxID=70415 RepID=A0A5S6Q4X0_TRIMR